MTRRVKTLNKLGISTEISASLNAFVDLFHKWNQSINLSAAKTTDEIELHVIDCLHVVPHLRSATRVVDVGAGGGLPVVLAAMCLPDTSFVALEPVHKKHAFLRTAARELRLGNLEAFAQRVEDHEPRDYDGACSRATFDLDEWLALGLTLVNPGGVVVGFEAIQRDDLSMQIERHSYVLDDKTRAIVVARREP